MLSFFKRKKQSDEELKTDGREMAVSAQEVTGEETAAADEEVTTALSLHPSQTVAKEQMYVLRFLNNELPPLKRNQLSLSGIEWNEQGGIISVTAFVRSSVPREITLGEVPLLLVNEKNELKARSVFDLKELGALPADSSRPWTFVYPPSAVLPDVELGKENWSLSFDLTSKEHQLDLDEKWEELLPEEQKENLRKIVKGLGAPGKNQLNFTGLSVAPVDNGNLTVSLLIRNGYDRSINIEKLPLQLVDAAGDIVAEGQFNVENMTVKANTTRPWTFIFPASHLKKQQPDFSRWSIRVIQN